MYCTCYSLFIQKSILLRISSTLAHSTWSHVVLYLLVLSYTHCGAYSNFVTLILWSKYCQSMITGHYRVPAKWHLDKYSICYNTCTCAMASNVLVITLKYVYLSIGQKKHLSTITWCYHLLHVHVCSVVYDFTLVENTCIIRLHWIYRASFSRGDKGSAKF